MRRISKMAGVLAAAFVLAAATPASDVPSKLDSARQAYQKGDLVLSVRDLQAALIDLQGRLGKEFAQAMPQVPAGWSAEEAEVEGLGAVGGGLSVTRAYTKGDQSLNASIILDNPAVEAAASLAANPALQPNLKPVKIGGQDALLRWNADSKSGDISMVMGHRVLVQIEGDNLSSPEALTDLANGFNLGAIRKLAG